MVLTMPVVFKEHPALAPKARGRISSLLAWPVKRRSGYLAMLAIASAYTVVCALLAWRGVDPVPGPWLRIPAESYYLWALLFYGATLLAGWLLAAAVMQLWARALGGVGAFEDLVATLGMATALATLPTLVPDLVTNLLGIYDGPWSKTWWGWSLAIGWMTAYLVLFLTLYPRAVRAVHGLNRRRSLFVGLGGFVLYQGFIFVFIR
jgi:hypothetical protein